eukprot:Pgem_evm1s17370
MRGIDPVIEGQMAPVYTVYVFYLAWSSNVLHQCEGEAPNRCTLCQPDSYHFNAYCTRRVEIMRQSQGHLHYSTFYPEGRLLGPRYLMILSPQGTTWQRPPDDMARRRLERLRTATVATTTTTIN